MRTYEKPQIMRKPILVGNRIANTCWGYHSGGSPTWWYDKNGTARGFVSFFIHKGQKCGDLDQMVTITWYQNRNALNNGEGYEVVKDQPVVTDYGETVYPYNDTYDYLIAAGGSQGNPFSGENNLIQDNDSMI